MRNQHTRRPLAHGRAILWVAVMALSAPELRAAPATGVDGTGATAVVAKEDPERRRFLRNPFKKERREKDGKAVTDMRDFVEGLTGQQAPAAAPESEPDRPTGPTPAATSGGTAVEVVEEKKRRRFRLFRRGGDAEAAQAPEVTPPPVVTANESKVLVPVPLPRTAGGEPPSDRELLEQPAPVAGEESGRRRWLRSPFGRKDRESGEVAELDNDLGASAESGGGGRRRVLGLISGKDRSEQAEVPAEEVAGEPAQAPEETVAETATPPAERRRLLRLPFRKSDEEVPVEPEEVAAVADPRPEEPAKRKGGFLRRLGGGSKPAAGGEEDPPAPTRDIGTGDRYVVTVDGTPFYAIGPSQPMPPEAILSKGLVVTMRTAGWGWCDVVLPDGQMGVIATNNLRKGSPGGGYASRRSDNRRHWRVLNFNPAPEPDLPSGAGDFPMELGLLPPLDDE